VLAARLINQRLSETTFRAPEEVVAWLGAVQAQDYPSAKWGLGLRAAGLTEADVDRAFDTGKILRTHVLRPTWHFVTPLDIRWMLALTGPRVQAMNRVYGRRHGFDARTFMRARVVIERALERRQYLTRMELSAELRRARIEARAQGLAHLVIDVELEAAICSGPRRGTNFTYALFSERAPHARTLSRDESLAELTRRYFQSHGPATVRDFAWWSGLTMKDARAGIAMTRPDVLASPPTLQRVRGRHYLLPNYDEYLIAYKDRGAVLDPARARNLGMLTTLEYPHQVIVDGRVAGSWKRATTATSVDVIVKMYGELTASHRQALTRETERLGRFLERPATLQAP
jgi:hypothetical protein